MLGLDPEAPIPLDVLCASGPLPVQHCIDLWEQRGLPTPVSGDPHFRRKETS